MRTCNESTGTVPTAAASAPREHAMTRPLTFEALTRLEPRLARLAAAIRAHPPVEDPDRLWYGPGGWKARMSRLVGHFRADDGPAVLFSSDGYQVAYAALYALADRNRALSIKVSPYFAA
jgi:hypothetical protein